MSSKVIFRSSLLSKKLLYITYCRLLSLRLAGIWHPYVIKDNDIRFSNNFVIRAQSNNCCTFNSKDNIYLQFLIQISIISLTTLYITLIRNIILILRTYIFLFFKLSAIFWNKIVFQPLFEDMVNVGYSVTFNTRLCSFSSEIA